MSHLSSTTANHCLGTSTPLSHLAVSDGMVLQLHAAASASCLLCMQDPHFKSPFLPWPNKVELEDIEESDDGVKDIQE